MDDAVRARGGSWPRYDANVDEYDDGVCIDVNVDDDGPIQTCPRRRNRDIYDGDTRQNVIVHSVCHHHFHCC